MCLGLVLMGVFHQDIIGYLMQTAAHLHSHSKLSFKNLHFKGTQLVFDGLTISHADYVLHSQKVSLKYSWPYAFTIHLQEPQLTLSPNLLTKSVPLKPGAISWLAEAEGGVLNWVDHVFPPAHFTLKKTEKETDLALQFEQGAIRFHDGLVECRDIPFKFLAILASLKNEAFPLCECDGVWSGQFDGDLLHMEGTEITCQSKGLCASGSFALDWQKPKMYSLFPERIRVQFSDTELSTPFSRITDIQFLSTFQSGGAVMCECSALCGELPFAFLAKAFCSSEETGWIRAESHFGDAVANLNWKEGKSTCKWEGISPKEISFIQSFAQYFEPRAHVFEFVQGTLKGRASFSKALQLDSLVGTDLLLNMGEITLGCKNLELNEGDWRTEGGFLNEIQGNGQWNDLKKQLVLDGAWKGIPLHLTWNNRDLTGTTLGNIGDCYFSGSVKRTLDESQSLTLSLAQIAGRIPKLPYLQGTIVSGSGHAKINYAESIRFKDWSASCKLVEGAIPDWNLAGLEFDGFIDQSGADLVGKGFVNGPNGLKIQLKVPQIRVVGEQAFFDVRLEDENWYVLRAVGSKEGSAITIDPEKSHLLGAPLSVKELTWIDGAIATARLDTVVQWPVLELLLKKAGLPASVKLPFTDIQIEGQYDLHQPATVSLKAADWLASIEYDQALWKLKAANADLQSSCDLTCVPGSLFQLKKGIVTYKDLFSCDFEGKLSAGFSADLHLNRIQADSALANRVGLKGVLEGQGCLTIGPTGIESDLDISPTTLNWDGLIIDLNGPAHLYLSSEKGALVQGVDARVQRGALEAGAKIDLIEFNKKTSLWGVQRSAFHIPTDLLLEFFPHLATALDPGSAIDCTGSGEFFSDFSEMNWQLEEASFPIFGNMRQAKHIQLSTNGRGGKGSFSLAHRDRWANISADICKDLSKQDSYRGTVAFSEEGQSPLSIFWDGNAAGISIQSIAGNFAGIDATFHATQIDTASHLIGSAKIDLHQLCNWIPADISVGFQEIGMGDGYELKGNLSVNRADPSQVHFKGILGGKRVELFNYQFRTMMSDIEFSNERIQIRDIRISDSAVTGNIDEILIQKGEMARWTIQMPLLTLEDLRPSLLRKAGEDAHALSPLIVRKFALRDFHGHLDDGKTYKAKGDLSFVNTYKRGDTVFDLPSQLFGKIIGLDIDLLIPVVGDLTFELKDGFFQLTELENAFSEGKRSEFFLADTPARVDLRGNLQILIKMKQFVLFALTKGFVIAIDGNLADPQISLQKKRT